MRRQPGDPEIDRETIRHYSRLSVVCDNCQEAGHSYHILWERTQMGYAQQFACESCYREKRLC